ncbi:hypothetical protein BDY21DRAFT_402659 [Lineolata rhizophorae]|uniref:Uncharacterized protein n=1 Tax=Lineolata rhizophorae TaxID=578093 RepID=A0A6A6PA83_9PEZI|nr:hypothetical protein BDY21DRAFT_402659 [Lineolata rhizophorae]
MRTSRIARAERAAKDAAKDAKKAEKEAKKAAKEARKVASATPDAEEAPAGKKKGGWKRKSAALGTDVPEPNVKVARTSRTQAAEDETAPTPWRAPVARMW